MDRETFWESFSDASINYDNSDWYQAYFMKLNDQTTKPGDSWYCGSKCTKHVVNFTSSVAQTVFITGHQWHDRGLARSCRDSSSSFIEAETSITG